MSKFLAISLAIITLIAGIGIGYTLTPYYSMEKYENRMADLGAADRYVDLRYINAMIAHHRAAMQLAEQVRYTSQREDIRNLAQAILTDEPKAIEELYKFKKDWYNDSSKVKDKKVANLGEYDENMDLRFLNALIAHHEEGLLMVKEAKLKSSRKEILDNTDKVQEFLTTTLKNFKEWRTQWYGIK